MTKFKMATMTNQMWAEGRVYSPTDNKKLLEAVRKYSDAAEHDKKAAIIWHSVAEATLAFFAYCAPSETRPAVFDSFDGIPCLHKAIPPGLSTVFDVMNQLAPFNDTEPKR